MLLCLSSCSSPEKASNDATREPCPVESANKISNDTAQEPRSEAEDRITLGGETYDLSAEEVYFDAETPEELVWGIEQLPRLTDLKKLFIGCSFEQEGAKADLTPLTELVKLESLFLSGDFADLDTLMDCPALTELHLNRGQGQRPPPSVTVKKLFISQSSDVDWAGIEKMPNLEYLYFSEVDTVPDFDQLISHPTLQTIYICVGDEVTGDHDLSEWERPVILDSGDGPLPEWLPLPQDKLREFASGADRKVLLDLWG